MKSQLASRPRSWLTVFILLSVLVTALAPAQGVQAQGGINFPAQINKQFTPLTISPGGISRLTVTIFNPNTFALTNASWTDNLVGIQPGIFIATPPNVTQTCNGTVSAPPGGTVLSLSGGTVPAASGGNPGQCTVEVDVSSITPGNLINQIPPNTLVSTGQGGVTITNPTEARATLHVNANLPPSVSKSLTPTTIWAGQTSLLEIRITNNDLNNPLTQASITDTLPNGVVVSTPPAPTLTNCGLGASVNASGNTVTLNNGTIAPSMTCVISVNVTANTAGVYDNTIPAGSLQTQQGATNGSPATATLNVQSVGVIKAFEPPAFTPPGTTLLTITLQNSTGSPKTVVSLSDTLPGNVLTYVAGTAATTCAGGTATLSGTPLRTLTLTGGTIPPGSPAVPGTCTLTAQVTAPANSAGAVFTNVIAPGALTTTTGDTNVVPASDRVRIYPPGGGVTGTKAFNPSVIPAGGNSELIIRITAPADSGLTNFAITDTLPSGVTISNSSPASANANCGPTPPRLLNAVTGSNVITLTGGTIAAGTTCRISVFVTGNIPGAYVNVIPPTNITNTENRTVPGDLTDTLTIQNVSDLGASKIFDPGTVAPGGVSLLTITLTNNNALPLVNASVTDNLPGTPANGLVVAPVPNPTTSCAGGIVTAVPGSQTITMTGGTIPAQVGGTAGACNIQLNVQANGLPATHANIIPVTNVSGTIQGTTTTIHPVLPAGANLVIQGLSIAIVKGFNPLTVFGGSASTLSVELLNPNNFPLSGIAFTDNMPAGMIVANPPNLNPNSCGGTIVGAPGSGSFSFSGGSLPGLGTCFMTLSVTMTVNGNLTNTIPAGAVTTLQGAVNPDPAEASLTNLPGAAVSKFFSPNPINVGGVSMLTITIQNTGTVALSGMGLVDNLPVGTEIAGAPAATTNCGGPLTAAPGTRNINLTGGVLGLTSSCTIVVPVTSLTTGCYVNTVPAGTLISTQGATNILPAEDTLCVTGPGTGMTKTLTATSEPSTTGTNVAIGEIVTYTTTVTVPPGTRANARVIDVMDRGLSFMGCDSITGGALTTSVGGGFSAVCASPTVDSNGSADPVDTGRRVTFGFGDLVNPGQADETLTIVYRAVVLDSQANLDGVALNNSASMVWNTGSQGPVSTRVQVVEPKLSISKTSNTSFIAQGTQALFTLTIQHTSASHTDAFDVVLEDTLPTALDYVPGSLDCTPGAQDPAPADCTFDTATRTIRASWPVFTLAGGTGQVTLQVTPNASFVSNSQVTNVGLVSWTSLPGPVPPQNSNPFSRERNFDPPSTIDIYGARASVVLNPLGAGRPRGAGLLPNSGFAPGVVTELGERLTQPYDVTGLSLEIPKIGLRQPVVGVALQTGGWDATWLTNQVGWLEKTAFPGFTGNSVLTSHITSSFGSEGPFAGLYRLNNGDQVLVHAFGELYTYQVRSVKYTSPDDISVLGHEDKSWLTLITCADYDQATNTYKSRLVVRAVLIDTRADRSGR